MSKLETAPQSPSNEKAPSVPAGFVELRNRINALTEKPLEERFSGNVLKRLTTFSIGELQTFTTSFRGTHDGRDPTPEEIENELRKNIAIHEKTVFESELMELLGELSLIPQDTDKSSESVFDKPFECTNEECLEKTNLVKGVYRGYKDENLSGDYFRVIQQKTEERMRTEILFADAEGHGGGATPLALLSASFLEAAKKEGAENPLIALDTFIASLPLRRSEMALQQMSIETNNADDTKTLSITQVGEMYAFWLEKDAGGKWRMKIIAPESKESRETIDMLELEEGSQTPNIGYGLLAKQKNKYGITPHPQSFAAPKDASVFFSSDGIFDAVNPETEKKFSEDFPNIINRLLKESGGKERHEVEENIFQEIIRVVKTCTQTDDETFFKVAA